MEEDIERVHVDLQNMLQIHQINELHTCFKESIHDQEVLREDELRDILSTKFDINFEKSDFRLLFQKIDIDGDGECSWDEFLSYLMVQFKIADPINQTDDLNLPLEGAPTRERSHHTHPIIRIRYIPHVLSDGSRNDKNGNYLTASKDGTINKWNAEFQLIDTDKCNNPSLTVTRTCVLDFVFLPDVEIICTASIECDLRFYDTRAGSFQLCLIISRFPCAINRLNYWHQQSGNDVNSEVHQSKIVLGDWQGSVYLLEFDEVQRNPFRSNTSNDYLEVTWKAVSEGQPSLFNIQTFPHIHIDIVTQVEFCDEMCAIFSSSECPPVKTGTKLSPGLIITDVGVRRSQTIIRIPRGVTCFTISNKAFTVATGGPDNIVRLWNHVVPETAIAIFPGHQSGIMYIFAQDQAKTLYSMDKSKIINVWNVTRKEHIQTYNVFATMITDRCFLTAFYNDAMREIIVGGMQLNKIACCPTLDLNAIDGYTHTRAVSVVLYNTLFETVVTCGLDSSIINWNLRNGEKLTVIKLAHTKVFYGETQGVEVTAACFNPTNHLLLSGAWDGSIKMWNLNSSVCIRHLYIETGCKVTALFWLPTKILAAGWDKQITEFSILPGRSAGRGWGLCHSDKILSCATSASTIATSSHKGELVLWKLDTGQPYIQYSVSNPMAGILSPPRVEVSRSFSKHSAVMKTKTNEQARGISDIPSTKTAVEQCLNKSVTAILFLRYRKMSPDHGTLVVALSNGIIQMYSHHNMGRYFDCFVGVHMAGDCIVAMTTDESNEFLFSGTAFGYIKTWHIRNYCIPDDEKVRENKPRLRLIFPFMIRTRLAGRAMHSARGGPVLLVNSYRAHLQAITSLEYIDRYKILLSSSSDQTVRLWTLGGLYLQTLGSSVRNSDVLKHCADIQRSDEDTEIEPRIPPDIKRVASSTTTKVLTGAKHTDSTRELKSFAKRKQKNLGNDGEVQEMVLSANIYLRDPILGTKYSLPPHLPAVERPVLEKEYPFIPIYKHLRVHKAELIENIPSSKPFLVDECFDYLKEF